MSRGGKDAALVVKGIILAAIITGVIVFFYFLSFPPTNLPGDGGLCSGSAQCFEDTVTEIVDGDTLYVGDEKIRLALVDTPEYWEDGYDEATQFASNLCPVGSEALVDQDDDQLYDSYGRMLAVVYCDGKNLNHELLKKGHGEILTQYCDESEFRHQAWAREYGC
jgi:micrococcal nuclease